MRHHLASHVQWVRHVLPAAEASAGVLGNGPVLLCAQETAPAAWGSDQSFDRNPLEQRTALQHKKLGEYERQPPMYALPTS
ncbi:hypothetical protein [Thermosporothrix hazakensis]|jgi:hypothetical protein|uniref:hypothetical protein n=1 Tax=Thermosporothrix hazakensis TaxID=644383 RepID=UPI0010F65935|nr:hypothetical protein [Thermosporothrix hazakensis]